MISREEYEEQFWSINGRIRLMKAEIHRIQAENEKCAFVLAIGGGLILFIVCLFALI